VHRTPLLLTRVPAAPRRSRFHCASRDRWIGWSPTLQWQRLNLIANNSRFLILPGERVPNLASRILGLTLARLSADWQVVHGHRLLSNGPNLLMMIQDQLPGSLVDPWDYSIGST